MVKINQLDENLNIEGKRVLLRVDFNVPINDGAITEEFPNWKNSANNKISNK